MKIDNKSTLLRDVFSVEMENGYSVFYFKNPSDKVIVYDPGLHHTAICKSSLCKVDKKDGKFYYRGTRVEEKIDQDFLDIAYEILFGGHDQSAWVSTSSPHDRRVASTHGGKACQGLSDFRQSIRKHFQLLPEQKKLLDIIPLQCHPMHVLMMAITSLSHLEKQYLEDSSDPVAKAGFIIAQVGVTVAYRFTQLCQSSHKSSGAKALENTCFDESKRECHAADLPYAEQILWRMHGDQEKKRLHKLGKILNVILILHAEHGLNCSAATVRNVASARGNLYTAIASGMAAFNGDIHGGASERVSTMYEEILQNNLDIDSYVDGKIARKELLMGFGQRTYNRIEGCWDPRVETMHRMLTSDAFDFPEVKQYKDVAIKLMNRVSKDPFFKRKNLTPNPDLFNCVFYRLFGVPKQMNTTMLTLGRITGWIANFMEHTQNRYPLTRPCDLYEEEIV